MPGIEAVAGTAVSWMFKPMLIAIAEVVKLFPGLGLAFIKWILKPEVANAVLNGTQIYAFWTFIRDLLNIFFLMTLLFSAFATIFQIEKFNYKKIFAKLVIAALLVNFSFPLARIVMDFANILLYSLLNLFSATLGFGKPEVDAIRMLDASTLINQLVVSKDNVSISVLLSLIVTLFLMGLSFFAMGLLLLIRLFVFAVLVIFSPIAFVAPVIPGMNKFSSMWWDNLLKYSFFAPIMMTFFYIALSFVSVLETQQAGLSSAAANQITSLRPGVLSSMILSLIPVFIMWIGMGVAMKMGIAGAEATMGRAQKFAKWIPKSLWKGTGVPGAFQMKKEQIQKKGLFGKIGGSERRERMEARIAGGILRVPEAKRELEAKKLQAIEEQKKKHNMGNMSPKDLEQMVDTSKDKNTTAAAVQELAAKGTATEAQLERVKKDFGEDSQIFKQLIAKIKTYDPSLAFKHLDNTAKDANGKTEKDRAISEFFSSGQFDPTKLNAHSLGDADFMKRAFEAKAISAKDIAKIITEDRTGEKKAALVTGKKNADGTQTEGTLKTLAKNNTDDTSEIHRNIQMAHFAQTGTIHDKKFAEHVFSNMDKDTARNMTTDTAKNYEEDIAKYMRGGRAKDILSAIHSQEASNRINEYFRTTPFSPSSNGAIIQRELRIDPQKRAEQSITQQQAEQLAEASGII